MELEQLFIFLGWIAIGIIAYTVYVNTFIISKPTPIKNSPTEAKFIFFSSTHCPWSKKAHPQWDIFFEDLAKNPTTYGGRSVKLEEIDGDAHPDILKTHNVTAYPTFKLVADGKETDMTAVPTYESFRAFLVKMLGAEEHPQLTPSTE